MSYSVQILGWFSAEMARASRSKRSVNRAAEILMATDRPSRVIGGPVHLAHAALSDLLFNPIGPELFANADRCLRLERTVVFQKALATLPRWTIEEGAVFRRGPISDALLSQD